MGFVLLAVAVGWLGLRATSARQHLTVARSELSGLRTDLLAGDSSRAGTRLSVIRRQAAAAHSDAHDPVWTVAAALPWIGQPLATARGVADAADRLSRRTLPDLAQAANELRPSRLRTAPDTIALAPLQRSAAPLTAAADDLAAERRRLAGLRPSWLHQVADARASVLGELSELSVTARGAATAARLAPGMLGATEPRRYFVAIQNTAESRGTGGLLGAYGVLLANRGRLRLERLGPDTDLRPLSSPVTIDDDFVRRYRPYGADSLWVNANLSPHFPYAAKVWSAMWLRTRGQRIDGVVALDPKALAEVVSVSGPVAVPGVGQLAAAQVEGFVDRDEYALEPDPVRRKLLLQGLAKAVVDRVLGGQVPVAPLLRGLGHAAVDGHLLLASNHADEQAIIEKQPFAGILPMTDRPFAQAVVFNAAGSKLDYYLDSRLDYRVQQCSISARRTTVTVTLKNAAPPRGLPSYVVFRADRPLPPVPAGQNAVVLQVFASAGARAVEASRDGQRLTTLPAVGDLPPTLAPGPGGLLRTSVERGHPVFSLDVELPPGASSTLRLSLVERPSRLPPLLPRQALARAPVISADYGACK